MFQILFVKEVRDHLLSLRVTIGLALGILLVATSAFVLSSIHQNRMREVSRNQQKQEELLARFAHTNRIGSFLRLTTRPPAPFALIEGLDQAEGAETLLANPMPELFPVMDLAWTVAMIFSLFAVVVGFDAFNGEKEKGTLRLILANRVSRLQVAAAKWAAGAFVLAVTLVTALLVGVLIVQIRAGSLWTGDEWLAMLCLGVLSVLYCWVFFTAALATSTVFCRSSVSVLASLFVWILLVLVIPSSSPYLAAQFIPLPSRAALERDLKYILSEERDRIGAERSAVARQKYESILSLDDLSQTEIEARIQSDPEFRQVYAQWARESDQIWAKVNEEQGEKADRITNAQEAQAGRQFRLARTLSLASPLPAYLFAATELSATGFGTWEEYDRQRRRWEQSTREYLRNRYETEKQSDPTFSSNDFLDVSTRPRFHFEFPPFRERFEESAGLMGELGVWVILLWGLAMVRFHRFDVR